MIFSRIATILVFLIFITTPIAAERVFFSDGTLYNSSLSKDEILERFDEYSGTGPVIVFHDTICETCEEAMEYLGDFETKHPEIAIEYYDLHLNTTNKLMFEDYMKEYEQKNLMAPTAFIGPAGLEGVESIKILFEPFTLLYNE
ncbi:MAG: hypothetical protein GXY48_13240 [Methanomicrobiales archaeon]|nr:hypothetical protein [Methanomicrobiales archaeon]